MRGWLVGLTLATAFGGAAASAWFLFQVNDPPDETTAVLAFAWVLTPYLIAVPLAAFGPRPVVPAAVLVGLVLSIPPALYLYAAAGRQVDAGRQQLATSVLPGEDPDRGPAGVRHANADLGLFAASATAGAIYMAVPPAQAAVVGFAGAVGLTVALLRRTRPATAG